MSKGAGAGPIGTQIALIERYTNQHSTRGVEMPRLNGQSSNGGMTIITLLFIALIAFALLEYLGYIDVLAFFGR